MTSASALSPHSAASSMLATAVVAVVLFFHKIQERATAALRCTPVPPQQPPVPVTHRYISRIPGSHGTSSTRALNVKQQL